MNTTIFIHVFTRFVYFGFENGIKRELPHLGLNEFGSSCDMNDATMTFQFIPSPRWISGSLLVNYSSLTSDFIAENMTSKPWRLVFIKDKFTNVRLEYLRIFVIYTHVIFCVFSYAFCSIFLV